MIWSYIKYIAVIAVVLMLSCTGRENKPHTDEKIPQAVLSNKEVVHNWLSSIQQSGIPPYYGGAYVENEILYIWTTSNSYTVQEDIWQRCKTKNGIIIKPYANSMAMLVGLMKTLDSLIVTNNHPEIKWYGHALDERHNRIIIRLGDVSNENIAQFKRYILDSPYFNYEKGQEAILF